MNGADKDDDGASALEYAIGDDTGVDDAGAARIYVPAKRTLVAVDVAMDE